MWLNQNNTWLVISELPLCIVLNVYMNGQLKSYHINVAKYDMNNISQYNK